MMKCCVFGLGYIGLPTAAILANSGFEVTGVEIDKEIISKINNGQVHISEKGLGELVRKAVDSKKLFANDKPIKSNIYIIAVPTPFYKDQVSKIKKPNVEYVIKAAKAISKVIGKNELVILESTSPVGTTELVSEIISKESHIEKNDLNIAYCPERVLPGEIIKELINNDRVIGGLNNRSSLLAKKFYKKICKGKLIITNSKTAELVKLMENSFRDVNLAFANELSIICDHYNINSKELISIANHHPRVNILNPGCGVGGHCIAVDPWFLIADLESKTNLIKMSREVNEFKTLWVIEKIKFQTKILEEKLKRPIKLGCLGLTFKPNVDDIRESPAFLIVEELIKKDLKVFCCEPNLKQIKKIKLFSLKETIVNSDLIILLVAHDQFKNLDFKNIDIIDFSGYT